MLEAGGPNLDTPRAIMERVEVRPAVTLGNRGETSVGETQTPERPMRVVYNEEADRAYLTPIRGDDSRPARTDPEFIRFLPPTVPSPSAPKEKQFNDGHPWFKLNVTGARRQK